MMEMNSMRDFDVCDEVMVKDCTDEQVNEAFDCKRIRGSRCPKQSICSPP